MPHWAFLLAELGDFESFPVFHGGLVGEDAGDGEVQAHDDVHEGFAVLKDGGDEFVHEVAVGAAVAARLDGGGQGGKFEVGQGLFQALIVHAGHGTALAPNAAEFAMMAGSVPTDRHAGHSAFARAEKGDFRSKGILVAIVRRLKVRKKAGHAEAGDFRE